MLDANVLREPRPGGHANVRAWLRAVPDASLRPSALTLLEVRRGWEAHRKRDAASAAAGLAAVAALEEAYAARVLPVDRDVAAEWARLLGERDRARDDAGLAATARVHGLVVATRNVRDFRGRGVRVLDPFAAAPVVVEV